MSDDNRRRELSFSSEAPVDRWFGVEILDHARASVRLDFLASGRAPLLLDHDSRTRAGVIESAKIAADRIGRAVVRFGRSGIAADALRDVDDGILVNTSVGYRVHGMTLDSSDDDEGDVYRVDDWEPLEVSMVGVPSDTSVGMDRAANIAHSAANGVQTHSDAPLSERREAKHMADDKDQDTVDVKDSITGGEDRGKGAPDLEALEAERVQGVRDYCRMFNLDQRYERNWIQSGTSLAQLGKELVKLQQTRQEQSEAYLDMPRSDTKRYSLMRAVRAAMGNDWAKASLELKCSQEVSDKLNRNPSGPRSFFVPLDILLRDLPSPARQMQRDMTVAGVSGSNYLVSTDNQPGNFIELLRNASVALRMGVERMPGLKGNVSIPKMTAGNTAYWLTDETTAITESQPTLGQLALAPKNVGALTEFSHQLASQSTPAVETLLMQSITRDLGLAIDVGILRGSGASGQPTGIATTGSIGAFTGTSLAAAGLLDAQADVAAANALNPGCGYVTTPAVAALLMARPELPSTGTTRMWKGNMSMGSIFDFPAMSSAQMSSATMLFGWWPSVILAEWGVLELMVNPFSNFPAGLSQIRGWFTCDVGVRYAGAWSYSTSIT